MKEKEISLFTDLSALLTGVESLSIGLAKQYIKFFEGNAEFIALLKEYDGLEQLQNIDLETEVLKLLQQEKKYKEVAATIIRLWYLGKFKDDTAKLAGGGYYYHYEALIWKVIQAHPPGLTGGYFGYWNYKPEY
jgi:hypothetical protein